jgi:hypothetical protein
MRACVVRFAFSVERIEAGHKTLFFFFIIIRSLIIFGGVFGFRSLFDSDLMLVSDEDYMKKAYMSVLLLLVGVFIMLVSVGYITRSDKKGKKAKARLSKDTTEFQRGSEFHPPKEKWKYLLEDSVYIPGDAFESKPGELQHVEQGRAIEFVFLNRRKSPADKPYHYCSCRVQGGQILMGEKSKIFSGAWAANKKLFRYRFHLAPNDSVREKRKISTSAFKGVTVLKSDSQYTLSYDAVREVGSEQLADKLRSAGLEKGIHIVGGSSTRLLIRREITFKTPKYNELEPGEVRYYPIVVEYKLDELVSSD